MESTLELEQPVITHRILNVTKHFMERWAERIIGIVTKDEIRVYIGQNAEIIKEHANKTFQHAEYIWEGQLYDNVNRKYYMDDDMVLVVNTTGDALITIYKVDFGFPGTGNSQARRALIQEIHELTRQKEEVDFEILVEMEKKQQELSVVSENIKITEAQLKNLKDQELFMKEEIKNMNRTSSHLDMEIKKYTNMLVNSKEYREDLKNM